MIHQFFFYSGIVFWASIVFCCLVLIFLRRARDIVPDEEIYENELESLRSKKTEDKKFAITLEKYLDGEAKTTQYE